MVGMMRTVASAFCGIGVSEAYLGDAGFRVSVACDLDPYRCEVYHEIYPATTIWCGDLSDPDFLAAFAGRAKGCFVLIATPPCQGFSTLNPRGRHDPRNDLVATSLDLIDRLRPPYALIENVPGMLRRYPRMAVPGYDCRMEVLDAADFQTPQRRRRAIVLFTRKGRPAWHFPVISSKAPITLRQAIEELPSLETRQRSPVHPWHFAGKHSERHVWWMRHVPPGQSAHGSPVLFPKMGPERRRIRSFGNTYKRMRWDEPAPTLIAGSHMISSSNTVHPGRPMFRGSDRYTDARTLSVLEAMIVMGLASYEGGKVWCRWKSFPGPDDLSYSRAMTYIGEGLAPLLLRALVRAIPAPGRPRKATRAGG